MSKYMNIETREIGKVLETNANGVLLKIIGTGDTLAVRNSSLRRWWKQIEGETEEVVVTPPTEPTGPALDFSAFTYPLTGIASMIIRKAQEKECTFKITKSYIGVKYNNKTVAEIHTTKKGKTKLVVNSKSLEPEILQKHLDSGNGKKVPESYGWTLDFTVQLDQLTDVDIIELLIYGVNYRKLG